MADQQQAGLPRQAFWGGCLVGVGLMAAVDEIIFHQLLGWHHFYDLSTPMIGLLSDGLLHAAELVALLVGFFMLLDARRAAALLSEQRFPALRAWGAGFLGAGVFQLFDGLINHKVLRLHQIRYGVDNLLTYDLLWNIGGGVLVLIGVLLLLRGRNQGNRQPSAGQA